MTEAHPAAGVDVLAADLTLRTPEPAARTTSMERPPWPTSNLRGQGSVTAPISTGPVRETPKKSSKTGSATPPPRA